MKNIIIVVQFLNIICFISCINVRSANDTLVSVAVLFRHGDRAPKTSFPNDEYYDLSYWPMGYKQLTNRGKQRHLELGKWFRNRYDSFLPDIYSPDDIYVRSSDVDRTLMSAAVNLAGLYPPAASQVFDEGLNWQPVPIHTLPKKKDFVISMKKKCKKYNKELAKMDTEEFFVNINEQNSELYEYISNQTGWEVDDISYIKTLQSNFYTYGTYNSSFIPSWADNLDQDLIDYLAGAAFAKDTYTKELKRLRIGPFFYYLFEQFDNVIGGDEDTAKFLMLSGHESTIAAVLNGMGTFDYMPPEFASVVIWELRQDGSGDYYINMFYKKEASIAQISVDGCQFDCNYDDFKNLLDPITVSEDDWESECG
ncbi:hypothetical protein NQ317_008123 [Molorchus minor]|uniref:acid phosphatase n=1 Tax=Molorchus minor TaxID=1323400 RepID=A0ABQ9IZ66_9CUCU|nr:hypothetical protein NQ317_008123 [Molorchus minor]